MLAEGDEIGQERGLLPDLDMGLSELCSQATRGDPTSRELPPISPSAEETPTHIILASALRRAEIFYPARVASQNRRKGSGMPALPRIPRLISLLAGVATLSIGCGYTAAPGDKAPSDSSASQADARGDGSADAPEITPDLVEAFQENAEGMERHALTIESTNPRRPFNSSLPSANAEPMAPDPEEERQCAEIAKVVAAKYARGEDPTPMELMSVTKCRVRKDNRERCSEQLDSVPCGHLVIVPSDSTGPNLAQMDIIDVGAPNGVKRACSAIVTAAVVGHTGSPEAAIIAAPAGAYTCDSYIRALERLDPFLLVAPALIPITDLADDTQRLVDQAKEAAKENPALAAAVTAAVPGVVVAVATYDVVHGGYKGVVKVGRSATTGAIGMAGEVLRRPGDVPGNVVRESEQAGENVVRETRRVARKVCRVVFKKC